MMQNVAKWVNPQVNAPNAVANTERSRTLKRINYIAGYYNSFLLPLQLHVDSYT